jgi:hypothetical protein
MEIHFPRLALPHESLPTRNSGMKVADKGSNHASRAIDPADSHQTAADAFAETWQKPPPPLMDRTSSGPFDFPLELEQRIFELAALSRPVCIPNLIRVAWRVKNW